MRRAFFIGARKFAPAKFIRAHQTVSGNGHEPHKLGTQPRPRD